MSRQHEPELPAKVPQSGDALTPDLPPRGVRAPELWATATEEPGTTGEAEPAGGDRTAEAEHPAGPADPGTRQPAPKDPEPAEPTD